MDPEATLPLEAVGSPGTAAADTLLVGRYRLGDVLGRGASGEVRAAEDVLTGDRVAVKLVPVLSNHGRRQLRRELTALLALRLPGVVRLRDEGTLGDRSFVVTDRVDGVPFTAGAGSGWASWRPRVVGLLDALARVHLAGVVHRDLKPANVFVDRGDRVVILDFGLAQGRLVERSTGGMVEGTPRYMAPEQRAGLPSDERTDLYAVGAMVFELVTQEALTRPIPFERLRAAPVPPVLVDLVERMLADEPRDRPASALQVLEELGADPRADVGAGMPAGPWSREQLERLFVDRPKSFVHLAEDAAQLLFEEARGQERATRVVLDRWIRAGLATWNGDGRVLITRSAIEQIAAGRPGSPQSRLVAMLDVGADPDEVSAEARRIGAVLADDGHLERALGVLDAAELWARGTPAEAGLVEDRVVWSVSLESASAVERALHAVHRAQLDQDDRQVLGTLLRGARAAFGGQPARALELLRGTFELRERLEILWKAVRCLAASQISLDTHEREVVALEGWANRSVQRTSKWQGWLGYVRYRQQRYAEAAPLYEQAALTRSAARERAFLDYEAACAMIETGDFDRAQRHATDALRCFASARHPVHEALSVAALRMIDLRLGGQAPDVQLVDAAADCATTAEGLHAWIEAAHAFRCGQLDLCARLCERAEVRLQTGAAGPQIALCRALRASVLADRALVPGVLHTTRGVTAQVEVQVLGLLARAFGPQAEARARALELWPAFAGRDRHGPMELVSLDEVREWLELDVA